MTWFRRKQRDEVAEAAAEQDDDETTGPAEPTEPAEDAAHAGDEARGPWDIEDEPDLGGRVNLGSLRIPTRAGMKIRMEMERKSHRVVAVNLGLGASALQVQAFAAPRSSGLWDDLRGEIAASVSKQGGSSEERDGPFGTELLVRLPVRTPDGGSGHRPARFIGVDGPRWFVRGVLTGKAAVDGEAAAPLEEVLADVVVVRGHEARAPRDLLGLHMPGKPGQDVPQTASTRPTIDLGSPRGPEITEVR